MLKIHNSKFSYHESRQVFITENTKDKNSFYNGDDYWDYYRDYTNM